MFNFVNFKIVLERIAVSKDDLHVGIPIQFDLDDSLIMFLESFEFG